MNPHIQDSYRRAIATFEVLLKLQLLMFKLLLIWTHLALLIKPG